MNSTKFHLKQIAFPREHGSWGYTLEPLILSLLVGYSGNGLLLAVSTFFVFLAHQPVRIIFNKKFKYNFKLKSFIVLGLYSIVSFTAFLSVVLDVGLFKIYLFIIAMLLMFGYLLLELNHIKRNVVTELFAAISVVLIASNIVLVAGWNILYVIAFWVVLVSRAIPTTFYVRGKLQIAKKQRVHELSILLTSFVSLFAVAILSFYDYVPALSIAAVLMLCGRAFFGIYKSGRKVNVKNLGIMEFVYGILFVIIIAVGYNFGI